MFFRTYGLLGQNARNLEYIKGFNTAMAKKLADSKLETKRFLSAKGVKVPKTLMIIKNHEELVDEIFESLKPPFVVKPNNGYGGKGILIFNSIDSTGNYVTNTEKTFSRKDLIIHFGNIIDGFYSLSGTRDKVIIEKKIILDNEVELLGKFGLPDIRIIVFNMVPIMAMLRVPTRESEGKANIHMGACAVGIDIGTGKLTYITSHTKIVKTIPDIGDVRGMKIPKWEEVLHLAVKVQSVTNIGYIGCDVVLDDVDGPLLLEMNIRSGLEIQVCNLAPLKDRLRKVAGITINSVEKGVRLGRDLFSGDVEEKIKNISGKKVLGTREYLHISYNEKEHNYLAEIQGSKDGNFIDKDFALNVLKVELEGKKNESVKFNCKLLGEKRAFKFTIKELDGVNIVLGYNSMRGFLIDPFKYRKGELPISEENELVDMRNIAIKKIYDEQLKRIDKVIVGISKKLLVLKYVSPSNLLEEKAKFISSDGEYVPVFEYNELNLDLEGMMAELEEVEIPEIPLSTIYERKRIESINKIKMLIAFRDNDMKNYYHYSKEVYGNIVKDNLDHCLEVLSSKEITKDEDDILGTKEVKDYIKKFNHIYSINISVGKKEGGSRFSMKGDKFMMRDGVEVGKKEMRSIVAHEIEGHYLRKVNGKKMWYSLFGHGTAGYIEIDEGIAIYNQNRFLNKKDKKYYRLFESYFFVNFAQNNSFKKLVEKLKEHYDNDLEMVFSAINRLKRGYRDCSVEGIFMKDVIYLNGFSKLSEFLDNGGNLKELYLGKITIEDLQELKDSHFTKLDFSDLKIPFFL